MCAQQWVNINIARNKYNVKEGKEKLICENPSSIIMRKKTQNDVLNAKINFT